MHMPLLLIFPMKNDPGRPFSAFRHMAWNLTDLLRSLPSLLKILCFFCLCGFLPSRSGLFRQTRIPYPSSRYDHFF